MKKKISDLPQYNAKGVQNFCLLIPNVVNPLDERPSEEVIWSVIPYTQLNTSVNSQILSLFK